MSLSIQISNLPSSITGIKRKVEPVLIAYHVKGEKLMVTNDVLYYDQNDKRLDLFNNKTVNLSADKQFFVYESNGEFLEKGVESYDVSDNGNGTYTITAWEEDVNHPNVGKIITTQYDYFRRLKIQELINNIALLKNKSVESVTFEDLVELLLTQFITKADQLQNRFD